MKTIYTPIYTGNLIQRILFFHNELIVLHTLGEDFCLRSGGSINPLTNGKGSFQGETNVQNLSGTIKNRLYIQVCARELGKCGTLSVLGSPAELALVEDLTNVSMLHKSSNFFFSSLVSESDWFCCFILTSLQFDSTFHSEPRLHLDVIHSSRGSAVFHWWGFVLHKLLKLLEWRCSSGLETSRCWVGTPRRTWRSS